MIGDISANGDLVAPQTEDVATAFRYPAYGDCGLLAWQEYQVFTAFGYQANILGVINGDQGVQGGAYSFTDSHATTEVYLSDYEKYIIQDATFNFLFEDDAGNPLSWLEAQKAQYFTESPPTLDSFDIYTYYRYTLDYETDASQIEDFFYNDYLKVPQSWGSGGDKYGSDGMIYSIFPDWANAHDPLSNQGFEFGTDADAWEAIQRHTTAGESWSDIARSFAASAYYVSGFKIPGEGEWITVRLVDGSYDSLDIHTGQILHGSYDQIVADATGGPTDGPRDLNPGVDVSFATTPAYLLSYAGNVMNPIVTSSDGNAAGLLLYNTETGLLRSWDDPSRATSVHTIAAYDPAYDIVSRGDYDGDGISDRLMQNDTNGRVGYVDSGLQWHYIGSMGSDWHIVSGEGSSNFTGLTSDAILWDNSSTGEVGYWNMQGGENLGYVKLDRLTSPWQVKATNDFNGDGFDDIIWQNNDTGKIVEWLIDHGQIASRNVLDTVDPSLGWNIVQSGDFYNDGASDLLFQNHLTGQVGIWDLDPVTGSARPIEILDRLSPGWVFDTAVDVTGDGTDDIVMHKDTKVVTWVMDDFATTHSFDRLTSTISTDWHIV
jgi:hypothetical protein